MSTKIPFSKMIPELIRMIDELELLLPRIAAHKKVFMFFLSQLKQFVTFISNFDLTLFISKEQYESFKIIASVAREYQQLCSEHFVHCWAHSVLDNTVNYVPTELCALSSKLQEITLYFHQNKEEFFDPSSPQWIQYHLLDLKAISASIEQYTKNPNGDLSVLKIMNEKNLEINNFINQYELDSIASGIRVFSPIPVHYQSWRLSSSDLEIKEEIGKGVSAHVYYGIDKRTNNEVAIKKLKFKKLNGSKLKAFQRELSVLASVSHNCLLKFVGATDSPPFCIVTEWMPKNTLHNDLNKFHTLTPTDRLIAAFDIARGMQYLHSRNIIHRDLKSLNVLLDINGRAKICDFGLAKVVDDNETMTGNIGTPHWMAPELLQPSQGYDFKVDVYAYGIVLWEILTSSVPYEGLMAAQIIAQVLMSDFRPEIPEDTPLGMRSLIEDCWCRDPSRRPTFFEVLRRFKKGQIYFNDVNQNETLIYIRNSLQEDKDLIPLSIHKHINDLSSLNSFDENKMSSFVDFINIESIPQNEIHECWKIISTIDFLLYPNLKANSLLPFLQTIYSSDASTILRSIPSNLISKENILKFVSFLPSGNDIIDYNLLIFTCKNNCAGYALLNVINPYHKKIAFEIISEMDTQEEIKDHISEICYDVLNNEDPNLLTSAIRCLIKIKRIKKIRIDTIKMLMQSHSTNLSIAAHAAAIELVNEGIKLPIDLFDLMLNRWTFDKLAYYVVLSCLSDIDLSKYFLNSLMSQVNVPFDFILKALIKCSIHIELKSLIKTNIDELIFRAQNDIEIKAANKLLNKLL